MCVVHVYLLQTAGALTLHTLATDALKVCVGVFLTEHKLHLLHFTL